MLKMDPSAPSFSLAAGRAGRISRGAGRRLHMKLNPIARISWKVLVLTLVFSALFSCLSYAGEEPGWENPLRVHFIDVGQGDCSLIQCPDGTTILIDGGRIWTYPFLIDYLRNAGVEKIDLVVASHPHSDHYGALIPVIKAFPVGTILDPGKEHTTELYQRYLETVKSLPGVEFKLARAGQKYSFGGVEVLIVHPSDRLPAHPNDASIVLKLTYGNVSFLFTGDAERAAEMEMMSRRGNLRSTVLKVGHHGSRTSTGSTFLSRVSPRAAVISAAENNSYGHPHPEVMRRLQLRGIRIFRTDLQGTVLFTSNGREYRVEFPGKAVYPEYEIPEEHAGRIVANRETLLYYEPRSPYALQIPPPDRAFFDTAVAAEIAGFTRSRW